MTKRFLFLLTALAVVVPSTLHGAGPAASRRNSRRSPSAPKSITSKSTRASSIAQGKFVTGLKPEDFQVFEDGKPQKVTAFSLVNIPLERAERPLFASKPIEPDVRNNLQAADGRIYVIMLDDLHTAALRSQRIKLAAKQFIERYVGANDLAAVVHTSGRSDAGQEFTTSQTRLLRAVDKFMGRKLNSSTLNMIDDVQRRAGTPMAGDPADGHRRQGARLPGAQHARLDPQRRELPRQHPRPPQGRRAVRRRHRLRHQRDVQQSDHRGADGDRRDARHDRRGDARQRRHLRASIRAASAPSSTTWRRSSRSPTTPSLGLGMSSIFNEVRLSQDSLRVMGEETGGFAVVNQQRLRDRLPAHRRRQQLVLRDGLLLDQRSARRPVPQDRSAAAGQARLTVRARKGYVAPRGKAPEAPRPRPRTARRRS